MGANSGKFVSLVIAMFILRIRERRQLPGLDVRFDFEEFGITSR